MNNQSFSNAQHHFSEMINEKIHIDDLNEYLQMLEKYNCKIPEEVQKSISDSLQFSKILKKKYSSTPLNLLNPSKNHFKPTFLDSQKKSN